MYDEYGEPTESLVNDWNIDNDHRDEGDFEMAQNQEQQYKVIATWYPDLNDGDNVGQHISWARFAGEHAGARILLKEESIDIVVPVVPSPLKVAMEMTEEEIKDFTDKVKNTNAL